MDLPTRARAVVIGGGAIGTAARASLRPMYDPDRLRIKA